MCDNSLRWCAIGGDCVTCRATGSPRRSSSGTTIWQCKVIILECAAASHEIFEARSAGPKDLVECTRSVLWKIDLQRRHEDMTSMSTLDFYRDVMEAAPIPAPEPVEYVKWPLQRQQGAVLARLRSGTLRLSIETGRYRNIDAAHRLCKQCDMDTVEPASHCLYSCPTYRNITQMYIDDDICTNMDSHMLLSDYNTTRRTSNYIIECFKLRWYWWTLS